MSPLPYRPNPVEWPLSPQQVQGINDTIENIYTELRRLSAAVGAPTVHDILSATHSDVTVDTAQDGDIIIRSSGSWIRLPKGTNLHFLQLVAGLPAWGVDGSLLEDLNAAELVGTVPTASILHNLLSAPHQDTVPAAAQLGDTIVAQLTGSSDLMKFWFDGEAAPMVQSAQALGAQQFWYDGLPDGVIASALLTRWARKAIGASGEVPISNGEGWDWGSASAVAGVIGASVYRASNIFLADATPTVIPMTNVTVDDQTFWSAGSPSRLTVPSGKDGWYAITAAAALADNLGTGAAFLSIYVNGTQRAVTFASGNVNPPYVINGQTSLLIKLAAADYVELYVELWNTAGFTVVGGAPHTFLQMVKV